MLTIGWIFLLWAQAPTTIDMESWDTLARPWMTADELELYNSLSEDQRKRFRGTFVARRVENSKTWPKSGLFLPCFYHVRFYNDVRDQLEYTLGSPHDIVPNPQNSQLPSEWRYARERFYFLPVDESRVRLAPRSERAWDKVKSEMILHPDHLYQLPISSFGQTRLPNDIDWVQGRIQSYWLEPNQKGSSMRLYLRLPQAFIEKNARARAEQTLELLLVLTTESGQSYRRHAGQEVNLKTDRDLFFLTHLPSGNFRIKGYVYSGFLPAGLTFAQDVFVAPAQLPRVGTPILSQTWGIQGLEVPATNGIRTGGIEYLLPTGYDPTRPTRVLIPSRLSDTKALLQTGTDSPEPLQFVNQDPEWTVFRMEPTPTPFRVLATASGPGTDLAFSSWSQDLSPTAPASDQVSLVESQNQNYLDLDHLQFKPPAPLSFLYVNGHPFLASTNSTFSWPLINWGEKAALKYESMHGRQFTSNAFQLRRSDVFQEIKVRPVHLVVGAKDLNGSPVGFNQVKIRHDGQPADQIELSPILEMPKLWGIVVKDDLLQYPEWKTMLSMLLDWLKGQLSENDYVYVVHIAHRPQLILKPTRIKPEVLSALRQLRSTQDSSNYFNLEYLIQELTTLDRHAVMPHQVIMMTTGLSDELTQLETVAAGLRDTGLQIYNLVYEPLNLPTDISEDMAAKIREHALPMAKNDAASTGIRDNFQEQQNTKAGFRLRLGERNNRPDGLKLNLAKEAFNEQIELQTAGLTQKIKPGQVRLYLSQFFDRLTLWQSALRHVRLPASMNIDALTFEAPDGQTVSWSKVEWRP